MQGVDREDDAPAVIERELTLLVRRAQKVSLRGGQFDHPIERAAYAILGRLEDAGAQRPGALAEHFYLDASTISRQIAALQTGGLIERVPDEIDGRASLLRLTDHGQNVLRATRAERRRVVRVLLSTWEPESLDQFATLLTDFNAGLDRQLDPTHHLSPGEGR
jgi:DNA-binding MarR family transcriptional regulator